MGGEPRGLPANSISIPSLSLLLVAVLDMFYLVEAHPVSLQARQHVARV